jgi:hypothetical protein
MNLGSSINSHIRKIAERYGVGLLTPGEALSQLKVSS